MFDLVAKSSPSALERRGPERKKVMIPAFARLSADDQVPCVIRDVSASGAKLGIARQHRLPETFQVVPQMQGRPIRVRLMWRKGDFAGVTVQT